MAEESRNRICMSCMQPVPEGAQSCPVCGYDGTQQNPAGLLPIGTRLDKGSFIVGRILRIGTRSVDYAGYDVDALSACCIREYLPSGNCVREKGETRLNPVPAAAGAYRRGLSAFVENSRKLTGIQEDTALPVQRTCFTGNGTAYSITDLFDGMTLTELLKRNGGTLTWEQTSRILFPVMKGLELLHQWGTVHGGVCPDNILINLNGDVRLTGFGAEKGADASELAGYVAPEVYDKKEISPATDVYSLGAVYYRCLTGSAPQDAADRKDYDAVDSVPEDIPSAVRGCLELDPAARPVSVAEFMRKAGLEYPEPVLRKEETAGEERRQAEIKKARMRWLLYLGICLGAVALLTLILILLLK